MLAASPGLAHLRGIGIGIGVCGAVGTLDGVVDG